MTDNGRLLPWPVSSQARHILYLGASTLALFLNPAVAYGQTAAGPEGVGDESGQVAGAEGADDYGSMTAPIVVTALKQAEGQDVQDIPVAITALGSSQLDALNFRSLEDINVISPNVTLDANGTSPSLANFTIRGMGSNSSIVTIEPAVGLFINGVYQGIPAGSVVDNFDVDNVQILRGPQGTLFGRNVTGGAVLIETKRPSGGTGGVFSASLETGPECSISGAVETSLAPDVAAIRIAAYYRKDEGWFTNNFDNSEFGKSETFFVRPTLQLNLGGGITQTFIGEYGTANGDGPPEQGIALIGTGDGFEINLDGRGFNDLEWYSLTSETEIEVGFGDGVITNVFGYRSLENDISTDADASPVPFFQLNNFIDQEQWSNELRYAGVFGPLNLTVGGFIFTQDIDLVEVREPFIAGSLGGGGRQKQNSYGLFAQGVYQVTPEISLTGGLRYSYEDKSATIIRIQPGGCTLATQTCDYSRASIIDKDSWESLSPRLGVEYEPNDATLFYASFAQATRSGGYNTRITSPADPGTFDQEDVTTYEAGAKLDLFDRVLRANIAVYYSTFKDLQRTVNTIVGPTTVQTLTNGADASATGFESEFVLTPTRGLQFLLNASYIDFHYTDVFYDLSGDGVVDGTDLDLRTPRVSPWSFGAGVVASHEFGSGAELRGQVIYSYRSDSAANDANAFFFPSRNDLRANISYEFPGKQVQLSVFARNLLNEVPDYGAKLVTPAFPLGGFRVIGEGRSIGASVDLRF